MTNIDQRLDQLTSAEPRRPLSPHFTAQVLARVQTPPKPTSMMARLASYLQGTIAMRNFIKPTTMAFGLAPIALAASAAVVGVLWLQPKATLDVSSITTLANGDKRFWVNIDSCQGQESTKPTKSYYEIKVGSKLTPEQLTQSIKASCEADLLPQLFPEVMASYPPKGTAYTFTPGQKQYFTPINVTFEKATPTTITLDTALNGQAYNNVTLPLSSKLRAYEKGRPISLKDLKSGDNLTLVTSTTALSQPYNTEGLPPADLNQLSKNGFPIGSVVDGVIKTEYRRDANLESIMGEDWTRLVPDKTSPDGWKQLVPFDHNYKH